MKNEIRYRITDDFIKKLSDEYILQYNYPAVTLGKDLGLGRAFISQLLTKKTKTISKENLVKIAHAFAEKHMEYVEKNNVLIGKEVSNKSNTEDILEVEKNILYSWLNALAIDIAEAQPKASSQIKETKKEDFSDISQKRKSGKKRITEVMDRSRKANSYEEFEKYYANLLLEFNCAYPRTIKNSEWINRLILQIDKTGYTTSHFIEEIVNQKGEVEIIDFDRSLIKLRPAFRKEYIDNLLLENNDERHQQTSFREISVICYRLLEWLYLEYPEGFQELIQEEYEASEDNFFIQETKSEKMTDGNLRRITYAILFVEEYPDFDEVLEHCRQSSEAKKVINHLFPIWNSEENKANWEEIFAFEFYITALGEYVCDEKNDRKFYFTMKNSLLYQRMDFMHNIYGKDYTKIKGDYNRDMFIKEFNALFEKYSSKEEV